jgi:hypothetical protein
LGGFGGLESGLGLLCSLVGTFLAGVFVVFWGFFTDFVSIFLGGEFCLTGLLSTFSGSVVGLFGCVLGGQGGGEPGLHVGFVLAGGQGGGEPGLHVGFVLAGGQGGGEPGLHVGGGTGLQLGLIEPGWQGDGGTGLQLGLIEPGWQGGIIGRLPLSLPLFPFSLLSQSVTYVPCAVS